MADRGVSSYQSVRVHQALHGYSDGHRLLASSVTLKSRDEKALLVYSDISGPGARINNLGYLTGYPLPESGLYALARTWLASEMSRPGCVWTHTLLLDFSDLASINSVNFLLSCFRKPSCDDIFKIVYGEPLNISQSYHSHMSSNDSVPLDFIEDVLRQLYCHPKECAYIPFPSSFDPEPIVLEIWSQQWPRLRRNFRFCTMSFSDRSNSNNLFDLQLIPECSNIFRKKHSNFSVPHFDSSENSGWIIQALHDVESSQPTEFRSFLHKAGGDVAGGREMFAPLVYLFDSYSRVSYDPAAIDHSICILNKYFKKSSLRAVRSNIVSEVARCIESVSRKSLMFFVENIGLLSVEDTNGVFEVGKSLWLRASNFFDELLNSNDQGSDFAANVLNRLTAQELVDGLRIDKSLCQTIMILRPDIIELPDFWLIDKLPVEDAFLIAKKNDENRLISAIHAMIRSGVDGLSEKAMHYFGAYTVFLAVVKYIDALPFEELGKQGCDWLLPCLANMNVVAGILSSKIVKKKTSLFVIAKNSNPESVPNDYGKDPWLTASEYASGEMTDYGRAYLATYLLARGLSSRSRNKADLLRLAFDDVYFLAHSSKLPAELKDMLEGHLLWNLDFEFWDFCRRLIIAVVNEFLENRLSHEAFMYLTDDDIVFEQIVGIASSSRKGRSYLRRVSKKLKDFRVRPSLKRVNIVNLYT